MINKNIDKAIDDLSDKKFVLDFLNRNRKKLSIKYKIHDLELRIFYKTRSERSKRLIIAYIFKEKEKEKEYIAKIRILKNNDLAKKAWIVNKIIWNNIKDNYKYIAKPLYYFEDYSVFIYESAKGKALNKILKEKILSKDELSEKIKIVAKYLAKLHKIRITKIKESNFLYNYNLMKQVDIFYKDLKTDKFDFCDDLLGIIKQTKQEIKKFLEIKKSLIHGDFQVENFIFDKDNLKFIDFDLAEINDPLIDVGNFLAQIYYGGIMGKDVDYYRALFLKKYFYYNKNIDKKFINERINLYIIIAQIRNINYHINIIKKLGGNFEAINYDLSKIKIRLENLSKNPLLFFKD